VVGQDPPPPIMRESEVRTHAPPLSELEGHSYIPTNLFTFYFLL
jgi:hypothetical protein